jgi:hypothetical protein
MCFYKISFIFINSPRGKKYILLVAEPVLRAAILFTDGVHFIHSIETLGDQEQNIVLLMSVANSKVPTSFQRRFQCAPAS